MVRPVALVGVLCLSVAIAACDSASPTTPSSVTETFSGTLEIKGQRFHTFTTGTDASATITLTELNPSVAVGVGVGSQSGGNCVIAAADDSVARGEALQIGLPTGTYCVQIYDVGNATAPLAYTLTVTHR